LVGRRGGVTNGVTGSVTGSVTNACAARSEWFTLKAERDDLPLLPRSERELKQNDVSGLVPHNRFPI
jgi:hypothetical protein